MINPSFCAYLLQKQRRTLLEGIIKKKKLELFLKQHKTKPWPTTLSVYGGKEKIPSNF